MSDTLHINDTLIAAGFTCEVEINPEPGVRNVDITSANRDPVTGERRFDVAADAARALANAGYDILCYGSGLGANGTIATLMVRRTAPARHAA